MIRKRWLLLIIVALMSCAAHALETTPKQIYNALEPLTSRQLLDKGYSLLSQRQKTDSALMCYTIVANRYYDGDHSAESIDHAIVAMENMGNIYMTRFFDYRKAYEYLLQAQQLAERQGQSKHLAYIYLSQCNVWKMSMLTSGKQHGRYVATLRKAFRYALSSGDTDMVATTLVALCDEAVYASTQVIDVARETALFRQQGKGLETPIGQYALCFAQATLLAQNHHYLKAAEVFAQSADMIHTGVASERYDYISRSDQAYMLFMAGRREEATDSLKHLLQSATKENNRDFMMSITSLLHDMYAQMGQQALADRYQLSYLRQKDSLAYHDNLSEISDVETSAKLSQTHREMAQLAHRHRVQILISTFVGIIAVILLVAIAIVLHAYRQLRFSHRMLYLKNEALLHRDATETKYKQSRLDDEDKNLLLERITDVLEHNAEIYDSAFCLNRMAELIGASYKDVSQVVNERYGGNFNTMLNEYRIKEACQRLGDAQHYGHLTIEAIALSVGFKSRTGFAALFKRFTGMTPSVYQKMALAEQRQRLRQ